MHACLVFNPTARGDKARRFRASLEGLGRQCALRPTAHAGHASELAATACREGFDTIVAAGGDGTVSEVVEGMARVPEALEHVRLAVIPLGTVNVFARELGLPLRAAAAWEALRTGRERRVDLPCVTLTVDGRRGCRHFIQLAGAGLDSRAVAGVDWSLKKRIGSLAYAVAGLQAMTGPQPVVTVSTGTARASGQLVLVGNGQRYGGDAAVFPAARLDDGLLDVRVFQRVTVLTLMHFAWAILARRPLAPPVAGTLRGDRVELTCPELLPVQVDGDVVGFAPAVFTVRPRALRVVGGGGSSQ